MLGIDTVSYESAVDGGDDAKAPLESGPSDGATTPDADASDVDASATVTYFDFNAANVETFEARGAGVIAPGAGYYGGASNDAYVYYAPFSTALPDGGRIYNDAVVRYDRRGAFGDPASWSVFHLQVKESRATGYIGAIAARGSVVFCPFAPGSTGYVAIHDATGAFTDAAAWSIDDAVAIFGASASGFRGGASDGTNAYLAGLAGNVLRIDADGGARLFSLSTIDAGAVTPFGAVFDGRYVTLVPEHAAGNLASSAVRFDTTRDFASATAWDQGQPTTNGRNLHFESGGFDGAFVYFASFAEFAPDGGRLPVPGVVTRIARAGPLDDAGAWESVDLASFDDSWRGWFSIVHDGRYVYFGGTSRATLLRYDTMKPFTERGSWERLDIATLLGLSGPFAGLVFDGEYVYLVPGEGSRFLRFHARAPRAAVSATTAAP